VNQNLIGNTIFRHLYATDQTKRPKDQQQQNKQTNKQTMVSKTLYRKLKFSV